MQIQEIRARHFIVLDSLRGICASVVAVFHVEGDAFVKTIPFVANGYLLVDFFFVLSGFVIAASYRDKIIAGYPISKFIFLRLGRLYPLHLCMLAAYVCISIIKYQRGLPSEYTFPEFLSSLFLLQSWEPHFGLEQNHWNPPSWSISAEFWTYLIFAVISRFAGRTRLSFGLLAVAMLPILVLGSDRTMNVCFSGSGVARCAFDFSFGVIAYSIKSKEPFRILEQNLTLATIFELASLSLSATLISFAGASRLGLLCAPFFGITILIFSHESGLISRLLLMRFFVLIGTLSYSIYMTHEFVLARFLNLLAMISPQIATPVITEGFAIHNAPGWHIASDISVIVYYTLVLGVSFFTFTFVEDPARRWSRTWIGSSR